MCQLFCVRLDPESLTGNESYKVNTIKFVRNVDLRRNQVKVNFLVYAQDSQKNRLGRQNRSNIV